MKIIITGGGTGGHIYPALTIADEIKKLQPEADLLFVGTQNGLEKDIVPRYGYTIKFIQVAGFKRSLSLDTFRSAYKLLHGLVDARRMLQEEKPDLVIGTGGYVCGPLVFWAARWGIPTCIQEQNAMPGFTNKTLDKWVRQVYLGYKEAGQYLHGPAEKIYTGNPIRSQILLADKGEAIRDLGLDPDKKTVLVSGGSRGAQSINHAMLEVERALNGRGDVQVLHATGTANYEEHMTALRAKARLEDNIFITPYLHDMPQALAAADIAVFRSGAIGLAELTARGIPGILVPYPYATANHQEFNARALEAAGAARVLLDRELTGERLQEAIEYLLIHEQELQAMARASKALGKPAAAAEIARLALALAAKGA